MNTLGPIESALPPAVEVDEGRNTLVPDQISKSQWEVIQLCVHVTRLLGIPRSVREIFGFVFSSPNPVTFEEIVAGLGISNGSASHGLRYLRRIGALCVTYVARDRRDYYVAETSLGRLLCGYLVENISHHLADNRERIAVLRSTLAANDDVGAGHLPERVDVLVEWNRQVNVAITAATATLAPRSQVQD